MKRKYQVFISSTYIDLRDERQRVMNALLDADYIPAGMELFPPQGENAWKVIENVIEDCDYYVLIIGTRYGTIIPGRDVSYTEGEYDLAIKNKLPVVPLVMENISDVEYDSLPEYKRDNYENGKQKLFEFKEKVLGATAPRRWRNADDLPSLVSHGLGHAKGKYRRPGWIRSYNIFSLKPKRAEDYKNFKERFDSAKDELVRVTINARPLLDVFLKSESGMIKMSLIGDPQIGQAEEALSINIIEKINNGSEEFLRIKHPWTVEELQAIIYTCNYNLSKEKPTAPILNYHPSIGANWWEPPYHNILAHIVHICSKVNANRTITELINHSEKYPQTLHLARQIVITKPNLRSGVIYDLISQEERLAIARLNPES